MASPCDQILKNQVFSNQIGIVYFKYSMASPCGQISNKPGFIRSWGFSCRFSLTDSNFGDKIVLRNPNSWSSFKLLDCRWHLRRWCCSRCSTRWRGRWSGWLFHIMTMTTTMATSLVTLIYCLRFWWILELCRCLELARFLFTIINPTTKLWMALNLCSGYGLGQNVMHVGVSRKMYALRCGGRSIRRFAASCELEKCYSILLFHHEL